MSDEPRPTRQRTLPRPVRAMPGLGTLEETGLDDGEPDHRGGPRLTTPEPAEAPRE